MSIRRVRAVVVLGVASLVAVGAPPVTASAAAATPPTVSADGLPTVQIDGVVRAQVVVGDTVYATGSFRTARPAGAAPGTRLVARANVLAYDVTTGELKASWRASLDADGRAIAASADGRRIFVGGDFTVVNGVRHRHLVALDAGTGAVVRGFAGWTDRTVGALTVAGNTLYAGGSFSVAGGRPRARLASFDATTGGVFGWAPAADSSVQAIAVLPSTGKVVVGGRFTTLNGSAQLGMGSLDPRTGATQSWPANTVIRNFGADAGIGALVADATGVYAAGWAYRTGNFESVARIDTRGRIVWVSACRGDTYGLYPLAGVLYTVGHAHDCESVPGGFVQRDRVPAWAQRAVAFSTTAQGVNGSNAFGSFFRGRPAPAVLHWLPNLTPGTFTGSNQAAWSITGNDRYVVLGGEFTRVNGVPQQGLVRVAVRDLAPNLQGPQAVATQTPAASITAAGNVKVRWTAGFDRDDARLVYEVLRDGAVVRRVARSNAEHDRTAMAWVDTGAEPGPHRYRVRARDPWGNTATTAPVLVTAP